MKQGSSPRTFVWRLRLVAAMLAVVGQIGLSAAAMTLARDESSVVSHTEQGGIDLHHGHNEATCVACIALSFHAAVTPSSQPIVAADYGAERVVAAADHRVASPQLLPNSCRAPPREA